jgi:hypothetical protein
MRKRGGFVLNILILSIFFTSFFPSPLYYKMKTKKELYMELLNGDVSDDQRIKIEQEIWALHCGYKLMQSRDGRKPSCYELQKMHGERRKNERQS